MAKTFTNQKKKVKRTIPVTGDALSSLENKDDVKDDEEVKPGAEEKESNDATTQPPVTTPDKEDENEPESSGESSTSKTSDKPAASQPTPKPSKKAKAVKPDANASTRHSFIMRELTLDTMKDFIYTKKVSGDFRYTQEQAIEEAMQLLFSSIKKIISRPEEERELERKRSKEIRAGKNK